MNREASRTLRRAMFSPRTRGSRDAVAAAIIVLRAAGERQIAREILARYKRFLLY